MYHVVAQETIEDEIKNVGDTNEILVLKARKLLLNNLENGDFQKAGDIVEYAERTFQDSVTVFSVYERLLVSFWVSDYDSVVSLVLNRLDSNGYFSPLLYFYHPQRSPLTFVDYFFDDLFSLSLENKKLLVDRVNNSNLSKEEKEVLRLTLNKELIDLENYEEEQQAINREADFFLEKYPESKYSEYIGSYVREVYTFSRHAWGFFLGLGYNDYTAGLGKEYSPNFDINMTFEYYRDNILLAFSMDLGLGTIRNDRFIRGEYDWEKGDRADSYFADLLLGYQLLPMRRVLITPFVSGGISGITPSTGDLDRADIGTRSDVRYGLGHTFNYGVGVNFDHYTLAKGTFEGTILRFRVGYKELGWEKQYETLDGGVWYFSVGFGGVLRTINRK